MSKIIAKGIFVGEKRKFEITIEDEKLKIICNEKWWNIKKVREYTEARLKRCISQAEPIGGTYYPPENTLTAAYNGLQNGFFDDNKAEIEVKGELEPIPYEEGRIY